MTNHELNARAAEIMGWKKDPINREWYISDDGKARTTHLVANWNPAENIAQAFQLAEKLPCRMELSKNLVDQDYCVTIWIEGGGTGSAICKTAPETITRACVAAAERK